MKQTNHIHQLRQQKWKIRVTHQRWYRNDAEYTIRVHKGKISRHQPELLLTKHEALELIKGGTKIPPISPKGGVTAVELMSPEGQTAGAVAYCSKEDTFCYKHGAKIALNKALAIINGTVEARLQKRNQTQQAQQTQVG